MSKKILVVEDSLPFRKYLNQQLSKLGYDVYTAANYAEAEGLLSELGSFLCAILDYCLPDAENGEVIDLALKHKQRTIVLSATYRQESRDKLIQKGVLDYLLKDSASWVDDLVSLINRLEKNKHHYALLVDDSPMFCQYLKQLLENQYIKTSIANDAATALQTIKDTPEISIIITDYDMPNIDGISFIRSIRAIHSRSQIPVLGLSGYADNALTPRFLKAGANDFLYKPFNQEEFFCRIHQLLGIKETNDKLFEMANQDDLTSLWNRRYLFNQVPSDVSLEDYVAMVDIDHFKKVNDNFGHACGDMVIQTVANILTLHFKRSMVVRLGGEEFCIYYKGNYSQFISILEQVRSRIENLSIPYNGEKFHVTVSIGASGIHGTLDQILTQADRLMYQAKKQGRNQVVHD